MQGFHSFLPHFSVFCYFLKSFRFQPAIKGPWPKNWTRDKKSLLQNIPGCKISSKYPWLQNILVTKHPGCMAAKYSGCKISWLQISAKYHPGCKTSWLQGILTAKYPGSKMSCCKISWLQNIAAKYSGRKISWM